MLGFMPSCSAAWRRSATLGFSNVGILLSAISAGAIKPHCHAAQKQGIQAKAGMVPCASVTKL